MKALVSTGKNDLNLIDLPDPVCGPDDLIIKPQAIGICGTDLEIMHNKMDPEYIRYPATIGHEWTGKVIEIGSNVKGFDLGQRVVVEGLIPCQNCHECAIGATNRCLTYDEIGFTRPGAGSEKVLIPARMAHKISEGVSIESAQLAEPTCVVTNAYTKANLAPGRKILIIGDGTIGLIAATLAKTFNPKFVHMLGLKEGQSDMAKRAGVDKFMTNWGEEKYDFIFEAAGSIERLEESMDHMERGGTLLVLGYPGAGVKARFEVGKIINGDFNIIGAFASNHASWVKTVDLLNSGKLDLTYLVTHRYKLDEYQKAIETLSSNVSPRGKVSIVLD
jgi:2-desacetyl-2-hydroxyethyl bacteriochlorophyllide A dehydrogenase